MTIKLTKNTVLEVNRTGDPDNTYWHRNWRVSLGKKLFGYYILIWSSPPLPEITLTSNKYE